MAIKTASRAETRKAGRSSRKPGQSLVSLPADRTVITPIRLQQQHLTTRYGMEPTFAAIAAEFIFPGRA